MEHPVNARSLLVILEENHAHTLTEVAFELRSALEACRLESTIVYPVPDATSVPTLVALLHECEEVLTLSSQAFGTVPREEELLTVLRALLGKQKPRRDDVNNTDPNS